MNESNSLIVGTNQKNGKYLKKPKRKNFIINTKLAFKKIKEKSKRFYFFVALLFILIILASLLVFMFIKRYKGNKLNNFKRQISKLNLNNTTSNKLGQNNTDSYNNIKKTEPFVSKFKKEYNPPKGQNPTCDDLDPIKMFNSRLKSPSQKICKDSLSEHTCYLNKDMKYAGKNGVICKMSNIILDPSKWNNGTYTYKGPVDKDHKGKPILSKGFFNIKCDNPNMLHDYGGFYNSYFDGWEYHFDNSTNETYEELAPGKTIFFLSRNQDSPNLYHGGSEFINALSLMYLLNLEPEDIQVAFLESMTINDDPFYDLYSNLIGRGGKPIYIKNLNMSKKYHISNAIHVPINWDSPCFIISGVPACKYPTLTYSFYNALIDNYMNITEFQDSFISDGEIFYYPKEILESHKSSITFNVTITFQWRRVWPKGRNQQQRLLGNGPELVDKLASVLPKNILIRLIDTASLPISEQISIARKTDYFLGIHGAGLTLAIFAPNHCIFHEFLPRNNMNGLALMAALSGHKRYTDILPSTEKNIDTNQYFFFDVQHFVNNVLGHLKENNLI